MLFDLPSTNYNLEAVWLGEKGNKTEFFETKKEALAKYKEKEIQKKHCYVINEIVNVFLTKEGAQDHIDVNKNQHVEELDVDENKEMAYIIEAFELLEKDIQWKK